MKQMEFTTSGHRLLSLPLINGINWLLIQEPPSDKSKQTSLRAYSFERQSNKFSPKNYVLELDCEITDISMKDTQNIYLLQKKGRNSTIKNYKIV